MTKGCMIHIHQYTKGMVCLCVPFILQWFLTTSPDASRIGISLELPWKISTGIWASAISFAPLPWVHHNCWRIQVWTIMWSILETHSVVKMIPSNSIHHGVSSTLPCCSCFYRSFPSSLAMSFCEGEPWYPGKRWKWREQPADLGWLSCLGFFLLAQVRDDRKPWETCWSKLKSTFQRLKNLNAFRIIPSVDGRPEVWDLKWESMTKPCRFCNLDAQKVQATHGTMVSMVNKNH